MKIKKLKVEDKREEVVKSLEEGARYFLLSVDNTNMEMEIDGENVTIVIKD